jgi:uncharacterized protein (TIGR03435 family)
MPRKSDTFMMEMSRRALLGWAAGVVLGALVCGQACGQVPTTKGGGTATTDIAGTWQGTLHIPNHDLRTVLKIEKTPGGKLSATFYSIDQSGQGIPTTSISFENGELQYAIQFIGLTYEGKMSADGNSINGTSAQMGHSLPLVFERATPETAWTMPPPPPHIAPMAANANPGVEVATIKPTKPGTRATYFIWRGDQLVIVGFTLSDLIKHAYDVQDKQITGAPDWMDTDKFDINAKPDVAGSPSPAQLREMVKKLLADRFQLKIHTEHKTMSAYALTVAKSGPKMTKNTSTDGLPGLFFGPPIITLRVRNATISEFVDLMQSTVLDRPVVDDTGLTGHWDFSLNWTPDASQFVSAGWKMPPPSTAGDAPPPLFTAIQEQLGLKLEAEKTSVPVLVIDHVDHPSAN